MTKNARKLLPVLLVLSLACASSQATAYKTIGALVTAVDAGMTAYGNQVRTGGIAVADQLKVQKAYETYQAAVLPLIASKGLTGTVPADVLTVAEAVLGAIKAAGVKI